MYRSFVKPVCDFFVALILLLIFSPIIFIISVILFFTNSGSVFFLQQRPGLNNKLFKIFKFKTMRDMYDENGNPYSDEIRMTKIGSLIRSTSLDEIIQLINVVKGDMSLVGPRPLLTRYLDRYTQEQSRRQNVKPGITGWAQVNGRNAISWEQKFLYDIEYVERMSFWFDIRILCMTFFSVIKRKGISSKGAATMEEFKGSKG